VATTERKEHKTKVAHVNRRRHANTETGQSGLGVCLNRWILVLAFD
jgi:hypothetical protein